MNTALLHPPSIHQGRLLSWLAASALLAASFTAAVSPARGQGAPGSLDRGFAPDLGDLPLVDSITVRPDGRLIIGGQFSGITRFDDDDRYIALAGLTAQGTLDRSFHLPFDKRTILSDVSLLPDGRLYVVADRRFQTLTRHYPDGGLDLNFFLGEDLQDEFSASLPLPDGRLVALGNYIDGSFRTHYFIERLQADGSLDGSFQRQENTDGLGPAVLQPDGKVVVNGNGRVFRLNTDGSVDGTYRISVFGGGFYTQAILRLPDGKVLVAGDFTNVNGFASAGLARLNADGSVDTGFHVTADTKVRVSALALQSDGKVIVGGLFTRLGGVPRGHIARLNADGSVDPGFAAGGGADDAVYAITLQADNKVLIGGGFLSYDGVPQGGLARLYNTVSVPVNAGTFSVVGTPTRGGFVVSRSGNTAAATTVVYHNGGSATRDGDYVAFPGTLTFAAGQVEAVIPVTLLPGANRNKKVKVFLDLNPTGAYSIGKAQSKVFLSDL